MSDVFNNAVDLTDVPRDQWHKYIGNGYRSCCYTTDHDRNGQIILFGYDTFDNPTTFICPHKSHISFNVNYKTDTKDIFGNYVDVRYFKNSKSRREYIENVGNSIRIVEADKPETEFLHEMFDDVVLGGNYNKQKLRTFIFDIETEIGKTFEYPKTAGQRINMMTIYDTLTEKYYTWSLQPAEVKFTEKPLCDLPTDKFVLYTFNDREDSMLEHFISFVEGNYPDVWATWNGQAYDMPYLVRRIENVLGEGEARKLSPVNRYYIKKNNLENERANKQAEILVTIEGTFCADLRVLFKEKFKIISPLDGGYSLDNVGDALELGHKVKYTGSLKDLYEKNWQKFYEYNVMDVDLLKRIEEKCKMIPLAKRITSTGLCNYETIYSSISYLIGSLSMYAKTKMGVKMLSYCQKAEKGSKYEGAYVFEPIPGVYYVIITSDFNSLYPNTIRSMNISPETYIGHLEENWFEFTDDESPKLSDINRFHLKMFNPELLKKLMKTQLLGLAKDKGVSTDDKVALKDIALNSNIITRVVGDEIEVTRDQINNLLKNFCIITRNNDILVKHEVKKGVVSEWSGFFFNMRKATKKQKAELEDKIDNGLITDPEELALAHEQIQNLDDMQQAIKIMINSIYGCLGTAFSPIYNPNLAQSITRQGKFCNRNAARHVREVFKRDFNISDDYVSVASGDTDSIFIHAECIADMFAKKYGLPKKMRDWPEDKRLEMWDYCENFINNDVTPWVRDLVSTWCHTNNAEVLRYALEYLADVGIYQAKKNYAVHKMVLEGRKLADKIVYKGIELKKGNLAIKIKDILAPVYKNTLTSDYSEEDFRKYLCESYNTFKNLGVEDIAFWKGYNTARDASGFLQMAKTKNADGKTVGTTAISAACTYYNQLLQKLQIGDKYESLILGNKCRFVYVKSKKYPLKYIAFGERFPKEFYDIMEIDYRTMFEKAVMKPLERYFLATKFRKPNPYVQIAESIDDY